MGRRWWDLSAEWREVRTEEEEPGFVHLNDLAGHFPTPSSRWIQESKNEIVAILARATRTTIIRKSLGLPQPQKLATDMHMSHITVLHSPYPWSQRSTHPSSTGSFTQISSNMPWHTWSSNFYPSRTGRRQGQRNPYGHYVPESLMGAGSSLDTLGSSMRWSNRASYGGSMNSMSSGSGYLFPWETSAGIYPHSRGAFGRRTWNLGYYGSPTGSLDSIGTGYGPSYWGNRRR